MTKLLACVRDPAEASSVLDAGFDGVVLDAAADWAAVASRRSGAAPLVARIDDADPATLILTRGEDTQRLAIADAPWPDQAEPDAGTAQGILLRSAGRLLDAVTVPRLAAVVAACAAKGWVVALAGALEPPDLPRLLALRPDMLIVGRALRAAGSRAAPLDPERLVTVRALVPLVATSAAAPQVDRPRRDRIFVRDLVLALDIGAYASEAGRDQRVRFSVEAELVDADRTTEAMADIVSYDLIADTVRAVAARRRVAFVETLAEDIATTLLAVSRIVVVTVRVEKLDLGPGAVGVEITRAVRHRS